MFFHNQLLRGNRSTKADAGDFHAFWSMNMHPLAELGINIKGTIIMNSDDLNYDL